MTWPLTPCLFIATLAVAGCSSDPSPDASDGSGGGSDEPVCLDADQQPGGACAVEVEGEVCDAAPNPACAPITTVELSNPDADGPCLRLVIDNDCDETLYSTTCIEHIDDEETDWQCWVSTTAPGFDVDVGQCEATGRWTHYSGMSTGQLDTIEGTCDPRAD